MLPHWNETGSIYENHWSHLRNTTSVKLENRDSVLLDSTYPGVNF